MNQISADDGTYKCSSDEKVTITLLPSDPNTFGATYTFSSMPSAAHIVVGNQIEFDFTGEWMRIYITFIFTGAAGSCRINLKGSIGGDFTDPNTIRKIPGDPDPQIVYWTFQT